MTKFYQVGGSVRDEILGLEAKDIDYAVEAESYEAMRSALLGRGCEIFLETPKYFTIRARMPQGTEGNKAGKTFDFTLCRKDGTYSDGRHPDSVSVGTIYDDLKRRDFTINALAKGEDEVLIDPYDGQTHLKVKHLQCVGDARERFSEDGLRIIRAIRFYVTKGLDSMETDIYDLLQDEDFFKPRLKGVSIERIREELTKAFSFDTNATLNELIHFADLRRYLFSLKGLWLKPTTETR